MPLTTTQEDMRDAVRRTADVVAFTDKHPDTRINDLINQGLGALSRLCRTVNPEFQPIASTTVTTDGVETTYALPSNFRTLISVEYTADSLKTWLPPFQPHERALLTNADTTAQSQRALCYRIVGTNIELLPRPLEDQTALLWYATTVTQLSGDGSTMDTMDRLDAYVIWWAAREIAMEREAWERHDRLTAKMQELEGDIRILARSIDLANPSKPVDLSYANRWRWGQ